MRDFLKLLGQLANSKRDAIGKPPLCPIKFFDRVQKHLASKNVGKQQIDSREARHVAWLKYDSQKKHHENWEKFCVDKGFARKSTTPDEKREHGEIVFHDGQRARILQADEFSFTLNGSDEVAGGRPSPHFTFDSVPEAGQPTQKSNQKCTVLQTINFADEALPPFIIFPTSSKKEEAKINAKTLKHFKQVKGRYGLKEYNCYDSYVALSKNGSMTNQLWSSFVIEFIMDLYPDAADKPGKRVIIKADNGPGK